MVHLSIACSVGSIFFWDVGDIQRKLGLRGPVFSTAFSLALLAPSNHSFFIFASHCEYFNSRDARKYLSSFFFEAVQAVPLLRHCSCSRALVADGSSSVAIVAGSLQGF